MKTNPATTQDPALYPKFRNKDGSLTVYAFACGYIETAPNGFQLFKDGCWQVRRLHSEWESFDGPRGLTEARAHFRNMAKLPALATAHSPQPLTLA